MGRTARKTPAAIELGRRVRVYRSEKELSQEALAERAGLHFTYVSSVERGERNISLTNIVKLAGALKIDPGVLVEGLTARA